jgi:hypothetical protein
MFKKENFPMEAKYHDELKVFKNIQRSGLHRLVAHAILFPYVERVSWILKKIDLDNQYILNAKGKPNITI